MKSLQLRAIQRNSLQHPLNSEKDGGLAVGRFDVVSSDRQASAAGFRQLLCHHAAPRDPTKYRKCPRAYLW